MTEHPFLVTLWPSLFKTTGEVQSWSELGLWKFVENAAPAPCDTFDPEALDEWKKTGAELWSPTTFEDAKRLKDGAVSTCALVLDFDDPHADPQAWLASIGEVLRGDSWFAHTSVRSQPGACKWRLIVPLREALTPARWELAHRCLWQLVEKRTGFKVDPQAADVSRAWVRPTRAPGGFFLAHREAGTLVDGARLATSEESRKARLEAEWRASVAAARGRRWRDEDVSLDARKARALLYLDKKEPAISGSQGHMTAWDAALKTVAGFDLDEDSALEVLAPWNARCVPPWSEKELRHKVRDASKARAERGFLLTKGGWNGRR